MRVKLSSMTSLLALLTIPMLPSGCANALDALERVARRPQTVPVIVCSPRLSEIPENGVDALVEASEHHPEVGDWMVDLERHYQAQDACQARQ